MQRQEEKHDTKQQTDPTNEKSFKLPFGQSEGTQEPFTTMDTSVNQPLISNNDDDT